MKKALFAIIMATLTLAACTKDDSSKWIDGTSWYYKLTDGTHKVNVNLSLRKNGELHITDQNSYYWNNNWIYIVRSYTYDGDKTGTISLGGSAGDGTATFTLNTPHTKMYLSCPKGSYTLELR